MKPIQIASSLPRAGISLALLVVISDAPATEPEYWIQDAVTGCSVWSVEKPLAGEGVSWTGACADAKASGKGVLVFWNKSGLQGRYVGEMAGGKFNGEGRLFLREGETDAFNQYLGKFKDGKPADKGFLSTAEGARFYGELIDGVRHGKGTLVTREGWLVRGEIKDGEGVGTLLVNYTTEDGETYFGQVEHGERHGFGTLKATDDDFYAGGCENGVPSGPGSYKGKCGDRYTGDYVDGQPNVFGTSIDPEGNVVQGRFVNGEPDGTVLVTEPNGNQTVEKWNAGGTE